MSDSIAEITIPSIPESGAAVEGFVDKLLKQHAAVLGSKAFSVRNGALLGAKRALLQSPLEGRLGLTSLSFLNQHQSIRDLTIKIKDPGLGFEVLGIHPPYPASFVGESFLLYRFLHQEIKVFVENCFQVRLRLSVSRSLSLTQKEAGAFSSDNGAEELKEARDALGLMILCKTWKKVVFDYRPDEGCVLTLSESRTLPKDFAFNNAFEIEAL
jgi:hypothetical protein